MYFQKLLPHDHPYAAKLISNTAVQFPIHRHHELEILYCARGGLRFSHNGKIHPLSAGECAVIGSMNSHGVIDVIPDTVALYIDIGPTLLKQSFSSISTLDFSHPIISLSDDKKSVSRLRQSLETVLANLQGNKRAAEFEMLGCIYFICASLTELGSTMRDTMKNSMPLVIKDVLEYIHTSYVHNITLDDAAEISGYSKGNFCKIFKEVTGYGFHAYLNNYRIQNAAYLLEQTDMPIGEIAELVGFPEPKTFCRVFKEHTQKTPTEFRTDSRR